MGTGWRVLAVVPPGGAASLQAAAEARLAALVAEMSHWEPASLLSRFNVAAAGTWHALPPDFARVVDAALRIAGASDGAFDPAAGRLVNLWGFGPPGPRPTPDPAQIAAALAAGSWRDLRWDDAARRLRQPGGLRLDLSGIAKGHAADALAALLRDRGIGHALVEVGGELVGMGMRPDGDPWWVDLETPPGAVLPPLRVALHGLAVATSGDYVRGRHTLDPRTGRPAASEVACVSVLADSAMIADAWATVLTVADEAACDILCRRHGLAARTLKRARHEWLEYVSPALREMIQV